MELEQNQHKATVKIPTPGDLKEAEDDSFQK